MHFGFKIISLGPSIVKMNYENAFKRCSSPVGIGVLKRHVHHSIFQYITTHFKAARPSPRLFAATI